MTLEPEPSSAARDLTAASKGFLLSMVFRRLTLRQREIVALLKQTAIFGALSERELVGILDMLHDRTYAPGEVIFNDGEPAHCMYVVFKGEVEIGKVDADGKRRLARLGPGEVFGEVSFFDGRGRSATVTANCKTEAIALYHPELNALLERKPVIASKILFAAARQLGMRLRAANSQTQS